MGVRYSAASSRTRRSLAFKSSGYVDSVLRAAAPTDGCEPRNQAIS